MNVIQCDLCRTDCSADGKKFNATLGTESLLAADVCPDCAERVRILVRSLICQNPTDLESLERVEKRQILAVLTATDWNKTQAAKILGVERTTLDRKLRKYRATRPVVQ
jgi:transcriptional regulator of acetoin/glycerol metabolism